VKNAIRLAWIMAVTLTAFAPPQLSAQEMPADDETDVATHMHEHLARITAIKSLIIMGNLEAIREPARWLADHDAVAGLPANFEPFVDLMRQYARQVDTATDLNAAAMSVSHMARTCSNCHTVNDVVIEFGYDQRPAEWADTVSHMQRHQWAADRLWEGLIGPSDTAWNRGTEMLVDVPLHPEDVDAGAAGEVDGGELDSLAQRIHELAAQGGGARTPDARSQLYGEMLGICAECHTRLGRGPGQ
jgi:mono/diheme cytochrome c family protein